MGYDLVPYNTVHSGIGPARLKRGQSVFRGPIIQSMIQVSVP